MKTKSSTLKIFIAIMALLGIALSLGTLTACNNDVQKPVLGVWWWSGKIDNLDADVYLDFAKANGVTEIYYSYGKFDQNTDEFIAKASQKGMKVFWLAGDKSWVETPFLCTAQIDKYLEYQNGYSHKFSGLHFDIEPHQYSDFKTARREELLTKFVEMAYLIKAQYPDVYIEYDLPFWFEDEISVNGISKPVYAHFIDCASRITLMSYRDTAQGIYNSASAEINYAKQVGKKLNLGVATKNSEDEPQVSFMDEGKQVMYEEIAKLRDMIPSNFGVVIHHMKDWYDLKD